MIGKYKTLDNCIYEVFWFQPDKRLKPVIKVKCVKSTTREGELKAFSPIPGQIERNIKSGSWIKIE